MYRIRRRALVAGAGLALAGPAIVRAQASTGGVALVVGNSKYQWESTLPNVRRDVPDVAKRFQALGLKTEVSMDLGRDGMLRAVDKFIAAARSANLAAFYFAGHGVSWDYDSYIVPVDADLSDARAVPQLIKTKLLADAMKDAAHSLLVFDSCRNNPADGWRQLEATRTAVVRNPQRALETNPPNLVAMFSTAPGHTALDGPPGQNSPFAAALLRQLAGDSVDIAALPEKVRRSLIVATQGRQVLFDVNTYKQPFRLSAGSGANRPAGDDGRAVELGNLYAFANANDIPLPLGLVAVPAPAGSRHASKVGAFKYEGRGDGGRYPEILAVLSVDDQGSAYGIMAAKTPKMRYWRFFRGAVAEDRLQFHPSSSSAQFTFDWRDANSGSLGLVWPNDHGARPHSARFTRLD